MFEKRVEVPEVTVKYDSPWPVRLLVIFGCGVSENQTTLINALARQLHNDCAARAFCL